LTRRRSRRKGFFITDVLTGLLLIVVLAVALATAMNAQQRAARRFADEREAVRTAERVLTNLQRGRAAPSTGQSGDSQTRIEPLDNNWVRVVVTVRGRAAELYGPVPGAVKGAQP
jgi:type II secretory pathway pseudopilin PulG